MKVKRILPPVYFLISIVTMALLNLLAPISYFAQYPLNLLGIIPLVMGVALNLIADAAFKKAQTTVKPFEISTALITTGVFRISRHPMYSGMVLLLIGIAILMGALSPLIIIVFFAALIEFVFVRVEEKMLAKQFGLAWTDYQSKVRKWI